MSNKAMQFQQMIWQVRRVFQRLASESNDFLTRYDLTASQRTVLEFLEINEPETLANMARANDVSRQHIQQIVNDLLEKQLVETVENPAHKRSFLVKRTAAGKKAFQAIKETENQLFLAIIEQFELKDIETSFRTLKQLNDFLHSPQWEQKKKSFFKEEA